MEIGRAHAGIEILDKADAVVTALASAGELSVGEIASATNEPVSSTYRLLSNLVSIGWVNPGSRRGLYRLGLFFMRIGSQVEDTIDIRERSLPELQRLLEATGQTAYLCIRQDLRAVCIERLDGGDVRALALTLGASLPLVVGGAPKAILAFLPPSEYEAVLERSLSAADLQAWPRSRAAVERDVRRARKDGYTVSDGDVTPGVAALGAPVFNHRGELSAAVSVSGIREHILGPDRRDLAVTAILQCARGVSAALGWHGKIVR